MARVAAKLERTLRMKDESIHPGRSERACALSSIERKLGQLRALGVEKCVFGSGGAFGHCYELVAPLSVREVEAAEAQFGVTFPEDYRAFLTQIAAGGAGPGYGIFALRCENGRWRWDEDGAEFSTNLATPFPYTDVCDPQEGRDQIGGAIYLTHLGCDYFQCLVAAGPERGNIWNDGFAAGVGLFPETDSGRPRLTFLQWYETWLDKALEVANQGRR